MFFQNTKKKKSDEVWNVEVLCFQNKTAVLLCCTTQTSFRGEIFHDFPRNLVKITENRGNFGENIVPRIVVCVLPLQNTILDRSNYTICYVMSSYITL
jgi:hypothetical protein